MPRAPSRPEGSRTIPIATWNIRSGRKVGLEAAAKGLRQMNVGVALLQETKVTDGKHTRHTSGYDVYCTKAPSSQQGGIALLWDTAHDAFEVEGLVERTANVLTFQLVTGKERYFIAGCYLPPNNLEGIHHVQSALAAAPNGCTPLIMGDLNADLWSPRDERDEAIADLVDGAGLTDASRGYVQRRCRRRFGRRWTWSQRRKGRWIASQPDYILCREGDVRIFRDVAFRSPRFHHSDHRAVVGHLRRGKRRLLTLYRQRHRRFPIQLSTGPQREMETMFEDLASSIEAPPPRKRKDNAWISDDTWVLIQHRAEIARKGTLNHSEGRRLQRRIWASLRADRSVRAARVGDAIEQELAGGNVQEAFRHLKGWYTEAAAKAPPPCYLQLERQTADREELYRRRDPPGEPIPIHVEPFDVNDEVPPDGEIRAAVKRLSNGRAGGASSMRAEHMKEWLAGVEEEEQEDEEAATAALAKGTGDRWRVLVKLVRTMWSKGTLPDQQSWVIIVLLPKGGGDYRGIGLLEPLWKLVEVIMDQRLNVITLHDSLHGFRAARGTGTAIIEAKLAQQLACLEQAPFFGIFLDLRKAFDAMDRGRCIEIIRGYGAGPRMLRLIERFWAEAKLVCRASGVYGATFSAGRGVTQGRPLSPKLFNILVDAIVREWMMQLFGDTALEAIPPDQSRLLLAVFYADDAYLASRDPAQLQRALDIIVGLFRRVGLDTNTKKTQAMVCVPGRIRTRLPTESYNRLRYGFQTAEQWEAREVSCGKCGATLQARSLASHMASQHDVYVAYELDPEFLEDTHSVTHDAPVPTGGVYSCPVPECPGSATTQWGLKRHFRDRHPRDLVAFGGAYPDGKCERCGMQCSATAWARGHCGSKSCREGRGRRRQLEAAVASAHALRQTFAVGEDVLERVEVFKYLGRLLSMDDNDAQAVRAQLRKARKVWARVGTVLKGEHASPKVCAKFYRAVVQAVLLYGSETWNLSAASLKRLEGFNIRCAWRMAEEHKPRRVEGSWQYPTNDDVLAECGMRTMKEYIAVRRATVAAWVVNRPIYEACKGATRQRGSAPRKWWWEQEMGLDSDDAIGSDESEDDLLSLA